MLFSSFLQSLFQSPSFFNHEYKISQGHLGFGSIACAQGTNQIETIIPKEMGGLGRKYLAHVGFTTQGCIQSCVGMSFIMVKKQCSVQLTTGMQLAGEFEVFL